MRARVRPRTFPPVIRPGFRARLSGFLLLFAVVPALVLAAVAVVTLTRVVPMLGAAAPWVRVAESGQQALTVARSAPLTTEQREALDAHESALRESLGSARQLQFLSRNAAPLVIGSALVALVLLGLITSRVAGHLSRQLSRPVDELVSWTGLIALGGPLPEAADSRGAPEFEALRSGMRSMAAQLESGRARALEAERLRAFRESARRFAHELKNPLTPIRFALTRLRQTAPPDSAETIEVLATETDRLDVMARSFSQFGRLPEGPVADVNIAELVGYTARASVPERFTLDVAVAADLPVVRGQYDALARALSNVLLNAVEAVGETGTIGVTAQLAEMNGAPAVHVTVRDSGPGIPPEKLAGIWSPYVTEKPGGTGLGLAIVRQTVLAHGGEVVASSEPGATEIGFILPVNAGLPAITGEWNAP